MFLCISILFIAILVRCLGQRENGPGGMRILTKEKLHFVNQSKTILILQTCTSFWQHQEWISSARDGSALVWQSKCFQALDESNVHHLCDISRVLITQIGFVIMVLAMMEDQKLIRCVLSATISV